MQHSLEPCVVQPGMVHLIIVALGVFQSIVVAWLANRAHRKDKENGQHHRSTSPER